MSKKRENIFWPSVETIELAQKASRYGVVAALFSAVITALLSTWALITGHSVFGFVEAWSYIDAAIFLAIAYGIYCEKLWVAIFGAAFFSLEKLVQIVDTGEFQGSWLAIVLLLCYIASVRGLYALRQLRNEINRLDGSS